MSRGNYEFDEFLINQSGHSAEITKLSGQSFRKTR
jgi:hypothetical protein